MYIDKVYSIVRIAYDKLFEEWQLEIHQEIKLVGFRYFQVIRIATW